MWLTCGHKIHFFGSAQKQQQWEGYDGRVTVDMYQHAAELQSTIVEFIWFILSLSTLVSVTKPQPFSNEVDAAPVPKTNKAGSSHSHAHI